jgi:Ca-activated chloride channel family protein
VLSFLAPQFLWLLLALPVVIALHFIRARRRRRDVAALFLWRQARELAEARRRFSPSWLLLLQLLFVTLAALALAQPTVRVAGAPERIFVVDASASMAARDSDGVRLDKAVREAEALLAGASRVAVLRAGLDATVVQPLTSDHAEVRRALRTIEAVDARSELRRALELAEQIAPEGEIYLFSDSEPPAGSRAVWRPLAGDGMNVGISAFDVRQQQAFVAVVSNNPRPVEVELELYRGDSLVGRTSLLVPARGQANASFPVGSAAGFFQARLITPEWDALELDNVAYAGTRNLRVQLTSPSAPLERALAAVPGVELRTGAAGVGYDVRVSIGEVPEGLERGRHLIFAPAVEAPRVERIVDWDRGDPLMRFVDLTETRVGLAPELPPLEGEWQVLAQTASLTPVILRRTAPGLDAVVMRFHPSQTDMINRAAFPFLIANVMDAFRGESRLLMGSPLAAPQGLLVNGEAAALTRASVPGIYRIGDEAFVVSLLSAAQSRLPGPVAETVAAAAPGAAEGERQQSFALWLVALALAVLLGEWLLWSRGQGAWAGLKARRQVGA